METHIVKWKDGEHLWQMTVQPGKVQLFTNDPSIPKESLRSHADQWTEALAFVQDSFTRRPNEQE